jgi:hypothetical protein
MIGLGVDAKGTAKGYRIHIFFLHCKKNSIWVKSFINQKTIRFTAIIFSWIQNPRVAEF